MADAADSVNIREYINRVVNKRKANSRATLRAVRAAFGEV